MTGQKEMTLYCMVPCTYGSARSWGTSKLDRLQPSHFQVRPSCHGTHYILVAFFNVRSPL